MAARPSTQQRSRPPGRTQPFTVSRGCIPLTASVWSQDPRETARLSTPASASRYLWRSTMRKRAGPPSGSEGNRRESRTPRASASGGSIGGARAGGRRGQRLNQAGRVVERDLETLAAAAEAPAVSRELRRIAKRGGTEADFRREAARVFEETASTVGLTIAPRDEYHVARGKVDSLYNRLVLEYKKPGLLRPTNGMSPNRKGDRAGQGLHHRRRSSRAAGVPTAGKGYHGWVPPDRRSPCGRGMGQWTRPFR